MDLDEKVIEEVKEVKSSLIVLKGKYSIYDEMDEEKKREFRNSYNEYSNLLKNVVTVNKHQIEACMFSAALGFLRDGIGIKPTDLIKDAAEKYVEDNSDAMLENFINSNKRYEHKTIDEYIKENDENSIKASSIIDECIEYLDEINYDDLMEAKLSLLYVISKIKNL